MELLKRLAWTHRRSLRIAWLVVSLVLAACNSPDDGGGGGGGGAPGY